MEGVSRALGVGPIIELCGESFTTKGKILRHFGEFQAEIIARRVDPIKMMNDGLPALKGADEGTLRLFVRECMDRAKSWKDVTPEEIGHYLNTMDGIMHLAWCMIRHNDPERLTLAKVKELVCDEMEAKGMAATKQRLEAASDQASGTDALGNSTGHDSPKNQVVAEVASVG